MNSPTHNPYLLFRQTPRQLRRVGARGGNASARNRRAAAPPHTGAAAGSPPIETTSAAIAALDVALRNASGAHDSWRGSPTNSPSVSSAKPLGPTIPPAPFLCRTHQASCLYNTEARFFGLSTRNHVNV